MPRAALGASGVEAPAVAWSARALAGPAARETAGGEGPPPAPPGALVAAALDAGIDLFESWPAGDGHAVLARALGGERRRVALAARCVASDSAAALLGRPDLAWRPGEVRVRLESALRQLQSEWLDVWILHCPPAGVLTDDDLWGRLADDRQAGWVRAVAVAVDAASDEAAAVTRAALATGAVDAVISPLPLGGPGPVPDVAGEASQRGVAFLADDPAGGAPVPRRLLAGLVQPETARTPGQGVLAGVLSLPGVSGVVSAAVSPEAVGEHAAAASLPLDDAERRLLRARLVEARETERESMA